jgi:hypothetical protein
MTSAGTGQIVYPSVAAALALGSLILSGQVVAYEAMTGVREPEKLGSVSFQVSCKPQVTADFERAVTLLHSFWYDAAQSAFEKVAAADPDCAMAYWGEAMVRFPQINGWPEASAAAEAQLALVTADKAPERNAREAAYIHALQEFYNGYTPEEALSHAKRYADAMAALAAAFPNDLEAHAFYALALLASDPPDDVELVNPRMAFALLAPLFKEHPDHPGIAHYMIHACDNPQMARDGLEAARRYAAIAPASPHALHMPGHIFARLGLWQDDIRSNLASKAAAQGTTGGMHMGAENDLHATEFLEYAYLQIGHDNEAQAIVDEARAVKFSDVDPRYPTYYAIVQARYPALLSIETHNWTMAARLQPIAGADTFSEGLTLLAHAVAAGHQRDATSGHEAAKTIDGLIAAGPPLSPDSRTTVLRDEIHAWADFSQHDLQGAIVLLRPIADRQAKLGKAEVELPAREMLAEMLLLDGNAAASLAEYQASLLSDPNRFNALLGAGRAAEQLGKRQLAAGYYRTLLSNCAGADGEAWTALAHARMVAKQVPD